jgi:predicted ATP-binding protein involved in virulence
MEDLDKYIFDPKNPKGCKVYNLLLKIVKEGNNAAFISPYFFIHFFEEKIFDQEVLNSLWDKPNNFNELKVVDKVKVYEDNYSMNELLKILTKKNREKIFQSNRIQTLFSSFWGMKKVWNTTDQYQFSLIKDLTQGLETTFFFLRAKPYKINNMLILDKNHVIFSNSAFLQQHINYLVFNLSSVFVTTLEDYQKNSVQIKNLKPLLLKEIKDVHRLLDVLYRDLTQEKAKEQPVENIPYLKEISIKNFFAINNIKLQALKNKKEIYFVGENGDGKTVLLQAITLSLKGNQQEGIIVDFIKQNPKKGLSLKAKDSSATDYSFEENPQEQVSNYRNLFAYGAHRHRNDSDKAEETGYLTLFNDDQYLNNPVKWLQHLDYKQAKGEETSISLETAKELLKFILDNNVEIEVSPDEVAFIERGTRLKFEQLSEGYKSVIVWVSDLIKRLSDNQPYATSTEDFKGIALVDEIELHLHPKWKYRIVKDLRTWFPGIQFIFTTHSPTVILGASSDAVFYKVYKEDGVTKVSSPIGDISHLTANSLLTSPLFELESMAPRSTSLVENRNISSDDYIYQKIHQVVSDKINNTPNLVDADVMRIVEEELKKLESENDKSK